MSNHFKLIITIILTLLGVVGSAMSFAASGFVKEKDKNAFIFTSGVLTLVGNALSSISGVSYVPPSIDKKIIELKELKEGK